MIKDASSRQIGRKEAKDEALLKRRITVFFGR